MRSGTYKRYPQKNILNKLKMQEVITCFQKQKTRHEARERTDRTAESAGLSVGIFPFRPGSPWNPCGMWGCRVSCVLLFDSAKGSRRSSDFIYIKN
jgi:hypothetical protein